MELIILHTLDLSYTFCAKAALAWHEGDSKVEKAVARIILLKNISGKDGTGVAACAAKISLFTHKKHLFISATTNN